MDRPMNAVVYDCCEKAERAWRGEGRYLIRASDGTEKIDRYHAAAFLAADTISVALFTRCDCEIEPVGRNFKT